jgi:hypothetical protein
LGDARAGRTGSRIISGYGSDVRWVVHRDADSINVSRELTVNMVKFGPDFCMIMRRRDVFLISFILGDHTLPVC